MVGQKFGYLEVIEMDGIDDDFFGWDFDKIQKLLLEAKKNIKRPNKTYFFTCPNCGNEAYGGKASNGHVHVKCETCDIAICQ